MAQLRGSVSGDHLVHLTVCILPSPPQTAVQTKLFALADIPWRDIAFPSIRVALEWYAAHPADGAVHAGTITEELPKPTL